MSTMLAQPSGNLVPTAAQRLPQHNPALPSAGQNLQTNPMLPQLAQTGDLDAQYLLEEAQIRATIAKQYADVLQQLGYVDDAGNFLPGAVSVTAARQQQQQQQQSDLAAQGVTNEAQRGGYLFSGYRGAETQRQTDPFQRQIAQIGIDTPLALGHLYEQAAGLIDQYTLQNNLLLAQMAARRAAAIAKNPAGSDQQQKQGGGGDQGGGNGAEGGVRPLDPGAEIRTGGTIETPRQLPEPIVNSNPMAPGQVFTQDTSGVGAGVIPHPNPAAYGQPDPTIISPGEQLAPGSQLVGPDEMPKPNPEAYGQPIPDQPDLSAILDTINNALAATPAPVPATGPYAPKLGSEPQQPQTPPPPPYTQTNVGKYGKKPLL